MNQSPKHLIRLLEAHGFILRRSKRSHHIYYNPAQHLTVIVPVHGTRDLKKGTFLAIIKQAGIDKDEV